MDSIKQWAEMLFPLIILIGLYLFRYINHFSKARALREIAPFINGEVVLRPFVAPRIQGAYMGMPYQMNFLPISRNSPGRLQVKLEFSFLFSLHLSLQGRMPGFDQLLTRGKVIETGEESFDGMVLAKGEKDLDKARVYLDNPGNKEAILAIFQEEFESIEITPKGAALLKSGDFLSSGAFTQEQALHYLSLAARLMQRV